MRLSRSRPRNRGNEILDPRRRHLLDKQVPQRFSSPQRLHIALERRRTHALPMSVEPRLKERTEALRSRDVEPPQLTLALNLGLEPFRVSSQEERAATLSPTRIPPANLVERDCTEAHGKGHLSDVDKDGDLDLLLHYETAQTGIDPGDTQACLTGDTFGGASITGCDSIKTR